MLALNAVRKSEASLLSLEYVLDEVTCGKFLHPDSTAGGTLPGKCATDVRAHITLIFTTSGCLREQIGTDITGDLMLKLSDLVQQICNDIFGKLAVSLLFVQPCKVLILQLQLVEFLVEAVEWLGVALLVDEALTLSKCLLKLALFDSEGLDTVDLLLLFSTGFLSLASFCIGLSLSSLLNTCLSFLGDVNDVV